MLEGTVGVCSIIIIAYGGKCDFDFVIFIYGQPLLQRIEWTIHRIFACNF